MFAFASSLSLGTAMCSSSSPSTGAAEQTDLADGTFRGVFTGTNDLAGVAELAVTAADRAGATASLRPRAGGTSPYTVSGRVTLNVAGIGPIDVTGTLDLATGAVALSGTAAGAPVSFEGRYEGGVVRGELVTPFGRGPLALTNEELGGVRVHCGTFEGSARGRVGAIVTNTRAAAVFAAADGRAAGGEGTIDGPLVTFTLEPEGSATGTVGAGQLTGSWSFGGGSGAFAATESACSALTPPDAAADAGSDAGPPLVDAGPPGEPETVYTLPSGVDVGHLTVAGGRVVYSVGHVYFTQKRELATVGVDGSTPTTIVPVNDPQASPQHGVAGITVLGARVYWLAGRAGSDVSLWSVASAGGAPTDHGTVHGALNEDYVDGVPLLVNDGASVFMSAYGPSGSAIRSFDGSGSPVATFGGGDELIGQHGIVLDGANLLFGDFTGLRQIAKTLTGATTTLVAKESYGQFDTVTNVVVDADAIYFASRETSAAKLWRRPRSGGPIEPVITAYPGLLRGLTLVGQHLYFVLRPLGGGQQGPAASNLVRVAKTATNGTPTTIGPANLHDVATDGTWVYYGAGAQIRRVRDGS